MSIFLIGLGSFILSCLVTLALIYTYSGLYIPVYDNIFWLLVLELGLISFGGGFILKK